MGGVVRRPSRVGRKIGLVYGAPGFGQGAVGKGAQDEGNCGYADNGRPPNAYSLSLSLTHVDILFSVLTDRNSRCESPLPSLAQKIRGKPAAWPISPGLLLRLSGQPPLDDLPSPKAGQLIREIYNMKWGESNYLSMRWVKIPQSRRR
jgi:hypothetical protein